ncbi:hypothetical protein ACFSQ7_11720 [Paenibacillus rhizoplanae]
MDKTNVLLATSEEDALSFKALAPSQSHKVHVIPNFIRMEDYRTKTLFFPESSGLSFQVI